MIITKFSSKLSWLQFKVVLVITSTIALTTFANSTPFNLKSINTAAANIQVQKVGVATVSMIFQPKCSWCKKQGITMAKILAQCDSSLNITLIGVNGNKRQLKQALKHYHEAIPAFVADSKFLRRIGGYQASPTTLIYDADGALILKKRGYIAEDKLRAALQILSQGDCNI